MNILLIDDTLNSRNLLHYSAIFFNPVDNPMQIGKHSDRTRVICRRIAESGHDQTGHTDGTRAPGNCGIASESTIVPSKSISMQDRTNDQDATVSGMVRQASLPAAISKNKNQAGGAGLRAGVPETAGNSTIIWAQRPPCRQSVFGSKLSDHFGRAGLRAGVPETPGES